MSHREYQRSDRIAAQLRRELGQMVHEAVRDHVIPSVSVSDVEVTRDMAHAYVYVTALVPEEGAAAVKELKGAAKEFRRELARVMKTRTVPELHFRYDDSVDRGERIDALLRDNK
jgi:ribosome-binding factor A